MNAETQRWAFLSVQDTTGIVDFARGLCARGFRIVATPGTSRLLSSGGVENESVESVTGFRPILNGLVKSMHPKILAGLQVDHDDPSALEECRANGVPVFELVATNFAGFETMRGELTGEARVQVAPVALVRAAAVNFKNVLVLTQPRDYPRALEELERPGGPELGFRRDLALEAWNCALHYDMVACKRFEAHEDELMPSTMRGEYRKVQNLRYGENPQQTAALYAQPNRPGPSVAGLRQVAGRPMSYNNVIDADHGLALSIEFAAPGAVIIKHAMPVSAAIGGSIADAVGKAFAAEWAARVGAAVACNGVVDAPAARAIVQPGRSIDLVIAADFTPEAAEIFRTSAGEGPAVRLLKAGELHHPAGIRLPSRVALHHVMGGLLAQTVDTSVYGPGGFHVASKRIPTDQEMIDLEFACLVAKHTRSHATVLAHDGATVSVASVATDRLEATEVALQRCGRRARGAALASDSRLRPEDLPLIAEAGVGSIIHSGADPEEDAELAAACDRHDIAMIVTRMRHFSHV
jgi:phosphoribosylaminoimidazolecarboxamide formyltransferase / IMP cyclohydrolase